MSTPLLAYFALLEAEFFFELSMLKLEKTAIVVILSSFDSNFGAHASIEELRTRTGEAS
jgi:hypothetical protein